MNLLPTFSDDDTDSLPKNIIVFSHLRWDFVYQRPQHLLTRFAKSRKIHFIEEPVFDATNEAFYSFSIISENINVLVPHIIPGLHPPQIEIVQINLFNNFMKGNDILNCGFWYYTPMALEFSRNHNPDLIVYDCMNDLSAFKFAPESIKILEKELLKKADIVFTGGESLYEAKKNQHFNIYSFPSSIEKEHFSKAREISSCPADQINTSKPKLGFFGVIDERFDIDLIKDLSNARKDWQFIFIGPVVKIDPDTLPTNDNIFYLGPKSYQELPSYIATWDMALIPFLLNESTRFISPTKTPEYLAAGLPVISTPIKDVINPYSKNKLVQIGVNAEDFIQAAEHELNRSSILRQDWLKKVDEFLAKNSWDMTCNKMICLIKKAIKQKLVTSISESYV